MRDDEPASVTAFGTEIDNPVGGLDHVQVMFDHHQRVALRAQARERRDAARQSLAVGRDPAPGAEQEPQAVKNSIEAVARDWHAGARTAWTPRYAKLVLGRLEADIFPHLGSDDIDAIEPPRLLEVIRTI